MHFRHLWIMRNPQSIRDFMRNMEERTLYRNGAYSSGFRRFSFWNQDGEHEITFTTFYEVEQHSDRLRGLNFDKVSIEEGVELTWNIHTFLQICAEISIRALYGNLGSLKIEADRQISDDKMYLLNTSLLFDGASHTADAWRYSRIISDLSV